MTRRAAILSWTLRRTATALLTLVGVTFATYLALAVLPGDDLAAFVTPTMRGRMTPEHEASLRAELGLDRPVPVRYLRWCGAVLRGDLGESLHSGRPVATEMLQRLPATLELNVVSLLVVVALGLPLGWQLARRPGSRTDRATGVSLLALYALPAFWVALLLQTFFAVKLGWLPVYGRLPAGGGTGLGVRLAHLALPVSCLALHQLAFYTRFARDNALSGLSSLAALFARACGLGEGRILWTRGIRPSLVPLITLFGLTLPSLVSGSVIIETIFSWPGLGRLFVSAVQLRDTPVVLGLTAVIGGLTILGSLLADLGATLADPRHRIPAGETLS